MRKPVIDAPNQQYEKSAVTMRSSYGGKSVEKTVKDSEIKNTLCSITNADSEKWKKTLICVHLSTSPEPEWSAYRP